MTTNFNDSYEPLRLPKGWMRNLQSNWASTTTILVSAGECRDSTDAVNMALALDVTINSAVVGVNGLDTGTIAASTPYAIYALNDTSRTLNPCAIASTSFVAPILPTVNGVQYDAYRLIDWQMTGAGSTFLKSKTRGNGSVRTRYYDTLVATAVTAGTATSLTAIDLSAAIPPMVGCVALIEGAFTPATANDTVSFAAFGSTATVLARISGQVAAKVATDIIEIPADLDTLTPKILYINSAGSGATLVQVMGVRYAV